MNTPLSAPGHFRSLLNGPSGVREVFGVAFPLIISSFSWTVMALVDRMMLRWVNGDSMSAAFQANLVWFTLLS
jgi:MATE family multidrug resistance protein